MEARIYDLTKRNKFQNGVPAGFYEKFRVQYRNAQKQRMLESYKLRVAHQRSESSGSFLSTTDTTCSEFEEVDRMLDGKPKVEEYRGLAPPLSDFRYGPAGTTMLRSSLPKEYSPCVMDRTGWEDFYATLPKDYDIRNDPTFNCSRSTYKRLMNVDAPVPEPTTAEMLRTGYCGPDPSSLSRPTFIRGMDKRPEPAYRLHLSDRMAIRFMNEPPLESVLPAGRYGEMLNAKSVTQRDFKWRNCCVPKPPKKETFDREVHRFARTDLHGRANLDGIVKFDDDYAEVYHQQKLVKLKKAHAWPVNPITGESLGGHLLYHQNDPCMESRHDVWPCGEKDIQECNPICIPEDRCLIFGDRPKFIPRTRERHFNQKSYLDMRYPIRNYECWEEVPEHCEKPEDFPTECCFKPVEVELKNPGQMYQGKQ